MVQLHELELHRPDQVVELVQQPLVDVCVNGQLNTVQFYATTDSEAEVARCHFEAARAARKGGVDPESTACKLDKMIWLLCTGDFYREGGPGGGHDNVLAAQMSDGAQSAKAWDAVSFGR